MKKLIKIFALTIFLLLINNVSMLGQYIPRVLDPGNKEIRVFAERISENGWVYFKPGSNIKHDELFTINKSAFGLSNDDEMRFKKVQIDDGDGNVVYRYQQYYKGIIVEGAMHVLHTEEGNIELAHGDIIEGLNFNLEKIIKKENALNIALKAVNAEIFAWEDETMEENLQEIMEDSLATYYPKGELVITKLPFVKELSKDNFRLAYKFEIKTKIPDDSRSVWIDAFTGDIINNISNFEASDGQGLTYYNNWQHFTTRWRIWPWSYYYLRDKTRGDINTYWYPYVDDKITDKDNYWTYESEKPVVQAHWSIQRAWQYYRNVWAVTGLDNNKDIMVWVDYDVKTYPYAGYSPGTNFDVFAFGEAIPGECETMTSLDVVGHEYTHGIIQYSSNFNENGEPGALEESFADIFGNLIQEWVEGFNFNNMYTMAEDPIPGGIRTLHDPLNSGTHSVETPYNCFLVDGHPDTYGGTYWYEGDCHNGGKHGNCGVQNYWFYLLAEGDVHNGIIVDGIGLDKAASITYRNMVNLVSNDDFFDAREGALNAAEYYFGWCSPEYISTMNAWAAVGVGDPAPVPCYQPPLNVYITGPNTLYEGNYGTWYAHPSGGNGTYNYEWFVDYGFGSFIGPRGYQSSFTEIMYPVEDYINLRIDVTSGIQQASDYHIVHCIDCDPYGYYATVAPNPAEDILNVTIIDEAESKESKNLKGKKNDGSLKDKNEYSGDIIYTLFNNYGQAVYNNRTNEKRIRINTSNIPDGIYILKIVLKDGIITKQVVIHK